MCTRALISVLCGLIIYDVNRRSQENFAKVPFVWNAIRHLLHKTNRRKKTSLIGLPPSAGFSP